MITEQQKLVGYEKALYAARNAELHSLAVETLNKIYKIYDQIFANYEHLSAEERADIQIMFDSRPQLQWALISYIHDVLNRTQKGTRRNRAVDVERLLKLATIANSVFEGYEITAKHREVQDRLAMVIDMERFDTKEFNKPLRLTATDYAKRARDLLQAGDVGEAAQALGRALCLKPELQHNDKIIQLAMNITDLDANSAMKTMLNPFDRQLFVQQFDVLLLSSSRRGSSRKFRKPNWFWMNNIREDELMVGMGVVLVLGFLLYIGINIMLDQLNVSHKPPTVRLLDGSVAAFALAFGFVQFLSGTSALLVHQTDNKVQVGNWRINFTFTFISWSGASALVVGLALTFAGILLIVAGVTEIKFIDFGLSAHQITLLYIFGSVLWIPAYGGAWIIDINSED